MRGLVLSGGGARGAYEIGVYRALAEEGGLTFGVVTGTSVGALNAALIAQGDLDRAEALWRQITTEAVLQLDAASLGALPPAEAVTTAVGFVSQYLQNGGVDTSPLKALLEGCIDEGRVRRSPTELGLVTVEYPTLKPCTLLCCDIPAGRLIDYLMASSSLFPALQRWEIDGKFYMDGGYYDNLPVELASRCGADEIWAVDLHAPGVKRPGSLKRARVIDCYWDLGPVLDFSPRQARHNLAVGAQDGRKALGLRDGFAYTFARGEGDALLPLLRITRAELEVLLGGLSPLTRIGLQRAVRTLFRPYGYRLRSYEDMALRCAEVAGELFSVPHTPTYTAAGFLHSLRARRAVWARRKKRSLSQEAALRMAGELRNPLDIAKLGTVIPKEAIAAAFLYVLDRADQRG